MRQIDRDDLHHLLDTDAVVLVEALPAPQYDAGHMPGAVNLPDALTPALAAQIAPDRNQTVVT